MLVLELKEREWVSIGENILIRIMEKYGRRTRLLIMAPISQKIRRPVGETADTLVYGVVESD